MFHGIALVANEVKRIALDRHLHSCREIATPWLRDGNLFLAARRFSPR
jgi:hypothetical protein